MNINIDTDLSTDSPRTPQKKSSALINIMLTLSSIAGSPYPLK